MSTFRSIDELVKSLEREKVLLKEMFNKRKSSAFRYEYALELTEGREERIQYLIDYGILRSSGNFLELEDVYLSFFEEVLQVNEEINVSFVQVYLDKLNENIDYYLKETHEQRRFSYLREVKRCLKHIAQTTVRNVMDLKRNMDNTYKNEPNYQIKLTKLQRLDEKRRNIALLITKCEEVIDTQQPTFFMVAMDVQMRELVSEVKLQLNDAYHNLIEIEKQIIHYLNLIAYQNRIFEKVRRLKYLRDQFLLEENTDIRRVLAERNPVWMEPQTPFRVKLSLEQLRTSGAALEAIRKVRARQKSETELPQNVAQAIPEEYLDEASEMVDAINLQDIYRDFTGADTHLFRFISDYDFPETVTENDRILFFCQLASQYSAYLEFTDRYEANDIVEYPLIFMKQETK